MQEPFDHEGMSDVYHALDEQLDVKVVVKFLPHFASVKKVHLFEREGRQLARLKGHRNIVDVIALGIHEQPGAGLPYIVCEYLPKGDLRQMIPVGDDIDAFLSVAIDIVSGIAEAHRQDIVHRDIKPSNLFLGRDGTTKVGDFGISKLLIESRSDESAFGGGTPGYRAPEAADPNAKEMLLDVFSTGITFYEILTGKRPYDHLLLPRTRIATDTPPSPASPVILNPSISFELSDLVMEMIAWDPDARPQSFDSIRKSLEAERIRRAYENPDHDAVLRTPALQRIRKLVRDKIAKTTRFFGRSVLAPRLNEKPDWYADVLLRPARAHVEGATALADVFHPVYFAHFLHDELAHWSDWVRTTSLIKTPLSIDRCCSGLPIRLHDMPHARKKAILDNPWIKCQVSPRNQIEHLIIRRVSWLCSPDGPDDNIVRQCYATDLSRPDWPNAVGWKFRNDTGEEHDMSRDIETEILIPLYDPLLTERATSQDVLGVLNFEWDEALGPDREAEICSQLRKWIYVEQRFPLSSFIAQILRLSTEPEVRGGSTS